MSRQSAIRSAICWVLAATALSASAAKRMTVEQVQQIVASFHDQHRTDDAASQQLQEMELTERLTGSALRQMLAASPGPKTVEVLHVLADRSAFLDPAPAELPATPAPKFAVQKAIIGRTVDYVVHTMPTLPNLVATRVTEHYVDNVRGLEDQSYEPRGGLFLLGVHSSPVAFRDGRETDDPALTASFAVGDKKGRKSSGASDSSALGMSSWGEFGPILGVVLIDAAKGKLSWARWQQEDGKPAAVFQFTVDRSVSQYAIDYCCETYGGSVGYNPAHGGSSEPVQGNIAIKAGYHGHLEVDPETGAVLRITIEADLRPEDPIRRASTMVEYSAVQVGGSQRFCPTRSVSISVAEVKFSGHGDVENIERMQLNDVQFTDYHRFGSESTLITESAPNPGAQPSENAADLPSAATQAPSEPAEQAAQTGQATAAQTAASPAQPAAQPVIAAGTPSIASTSTASAASTPTTTAPAASEAASEIQIQPADGLPGAPTDAATPANNAAENKDAASFTLKVTTRSVDIGLIATDKHGKPIEDLKEDQLDLFDNGRKQQLTAFHHSNPGLNQSGLNQSSPNPDAAQAAATPAEPSGTFTNTPSPDSPSGAPNVQVLDTLILLMDESHLAFQDLNRARAEVLRFLHASQTGSPVGLYSISERGFRILQDITRDHALLEKKLAAWTPDISNVAHAQELDRRNRQQFDEVHNVQDLQSVNGNSIDSPMTIQTTDPELRQMGDNPLGYALETMMALARHLATVPGHKSLAWISGDSALADWQDKAVGMDKGSQHLEAALLHTREALNEANIALYAVDASAVEGAGIDASLKNQNIQLNQAAADNATLGGPGSAPSAVPAGRNTSPGRLTAQMQQDVHAIQGPVRQLAEATGGRALNRGSDLKATLDGISRDAGGLYELGFNPDTAADNKFHTLQVKAPARKDVVLRYRTGYLYNEETAGTKQRFQAAVWSPQDATGISLTAEAVAAKDSDSGSTGVKLRIAFSNLSLQQNADRWTDNLYIFVAQRDDATQKAEISGDTLRLSLKPATYQTGMPAGIPYQRDVEVKSRLGSVRVIVIDGNSGKIGSVTLPSSALQP